MLTMCPIKTQHLYPVAPLSIDLCVCIFHRLTKLYAYAFLNQNVDKSDWLKIER